MITFPILFCLKTKMISEKSDRNHYKSIESWTIDKGQEQACTAMITDIYEDENYIYSVPDECVAGYKVVYSNGEQFSLSDALEKKKVTIDDLMQKDIKIYRVVKKITWGIDKGEDLACTTALVDIYEDNNYKYSVPDGCVARYKIVYSNGEQFSLREALEKKKVTIDIDKNYDVLTEADVLDFTNNAEELSRLANQNLKVLLKELRNDRGLTQSQLADKLNLDTRQYQKYENQESPLPEDIAFQIITVLKLQPPLSEWLLNESGYTFKNDKKSKALKILMSSSYTKSYDFWTKTLNNIK